MFQWRGAADPTTYSRRLKKFTARHQPRMRGLVGAMARLVAAKGKPALISLDPTVVPVYGQKMEGAEVGDNPTKPGRPSYHPLVTRSSPPT